jgi:hypothetical protein
LSAQGRAALKPCQSITITKEGGYLTKYKPIKINFTEEENSRVKSYADQCGITVTEFVRTLIDFYQPKPIPDSIFRNAINQLYQIHEVLKSDNENIKRLQEIILELEREVLLPERYLRKSSKPTGKENLEAVDSLINDREEVDRNDSHKPLGD